MKLQIFLATTIGFCLQAQTYQITYQQSFEGKTQDGSDQIITYANAKENIITSQKIIDGSKKKPYEITKTNNENFIVDYYSFLPNQENPTTTNEEIIKKYQFKLSDETKKIAGYLCKKAITSVNSNTIEVWYTNEIPVYGGPSLIGQNLGLVLETTRNGNTTISATNIKKVKNFNKINILNENNFKTTDELSYKDIIWKSRFTTFPVFKNETINFSSESKSDSIIRRFANGTVILKKVKFPTIQSTQSVFVELTEKSKGDAYDRTGTVFIIPEDKELNFFTALEKGIKNIPSYKNDNGKEYFGVSITENYLPTIELMRFFTPFGVQHFNHIKLKDKIWRDKTYYRQEISELTPSISNKELWVGTFIGNYDKGGHQIDLEITIHDDGLATFPSNYQLPLFNTLNIMEMAGQDYATMFNSLQGLTINFNIDHNIKNAYLRYITTGHGGWENGDEFLPKANNITLDSKETYTFIPWRTDCGSYRLDNPASGNFSNGLSSSDLSRSNWCPGTVTNPEYIYLGDLKPGNHTIRITIQQGANEGSSFSSWNVSGLLLGQKENLPTR